MLVSRLMTLHLRWSPVVLIPIAALVFAGCPGELDNPEAFTDGGLSGGCDAEQLLETSCGSSACHDSSGPAADLDLVSPNLAQRLVGVPASCSSGMTETGCECGDRELVTADPNEVDNSYLLEKLTSSTPACDDPMPLLAAEPLPASDVECIRQWALELAGGGQ